MLRAGPMNRHLNPKTTMPTLLDGTTTDGEIPEELRRHDITCPNAQEQPAEPCASDITEAAVQEIRDLTHASWHERLEVMNDMIAGTITREEAGLKLVEIEERVMAARQVNKDKELEDIQQKCCDEASAPGDPGDA